MERPEHDFHVVGNEIVIDFAVPLPATGEDEVLTELLSHHAAQIIRDRKRRGQPLDGIPLARVQARKGAESVEVARLDLDEEEIPEIEFPDLLPTLDTAGYDPLAKLGAAEGAEVLSLAARPAGDRLAPLVEEIRLTAGIAAGLRAMGTDPEHMSMAQFAPALLRLAGYELTERTDTTFTAYGGGGATYVEVIAHQPGEYPELEERRISSFLIGFADSRTDRGLLLTDKYGPYEIYRRERANPRCAFITRERLQEFVDTIALG
jgi:hypothetical protein